jgi:hypothetical protein
MHFANSLFQVVFCAVLTGKQRKTSWMMIIWMELRQNAVRIAASRSVAMKNVSPFAVKMESPTLMKMQGKFVTALKTRLVETSFMITVS